MLAADGDAVRLLTPEQAWELESGNPLWNEGPEMIKHGGRYYLTYSGNCFAGSAYSVGYAVASEPLGPFVKAGGKSGFNFPRQKRCIRNRAS